MVQWLISEKWYNVRLFFEEDMLQSSSSSKLSYLTLWLCVWLRSSAPLVFLLSMEESIEELSTLGHSPLEVPAERLRPEGLRANEELTSTSSHSHSEGAEAQEDGLQEVEGKAGRSTSAMLLMTWWVEICKAQSWIISLQCFESMVPHPEWVTTLFSLLLGWCWKRHSKETGFPKREDCWAGLWLSKAQIQQKSL